VRAAAAATVRTLPRAVLRVGGLAAALRGAVGRLSPAMKRRLLAAVAAGLVLALLYLAWFRDSSFVSVEQVTVTGLTTNDAPKIRARLIAEAKRMSTLHVDEAALRDAIGASTAVAGIRVTTDFPHGMRIEVIERPPVAVLIGPGRRVAVAADGTLLTGVRATGIPTIYVGALPSGTRLGRGRALRIVRAAAAAPTPLRARIMRIRELPGKGLVAYIRRGPQVLLGDATRLRAKWAAAAAVLADGASRGATYVDVRIPDRPVAGGLDVPQPENEQPGAAAIYSGAPATGTTGPAATPAPAPGTVPQAQQPAAGAATQQAAPGATTTTP